jgi:hypothetical protein
MSENPYTPTEANLDAGPDTSVESDFYVVSTLKFTALFVATLGMYQVYWFYKNWRQYKQASGNWDIWPVPRAIFAIFFIHALFRHVNAKLERQDGAAEWNHRLHATVLVIFSLMTTLLDRLGEKLIGSPVSDILALSLLIPMYFLYASAQQRINFACGDPEGVSNSRFTWANHVWLVLGVLIWFLAIYGLYALATGQIE